MRNNMKNESIYTALFILFALFVSSCNGPKEEIRQNDDGVQLLITADSLAAVVNSAEGTLVRSFQAIKDSGVVEYGIVVRRNPSDKFGLSYRITESNNAFAVYHNNDFKLVYPDFKLVMVPDSGLNPANLAETYRKILAPVIKLEAQKEMIKAAKSVQYIGLEDFNGDMCHVISVKDTVGDEALAIDYYIGRETGMLKKMVSERFNLMDKTSKHDMIVLKNFRVNTEPPDSMFLFSIPKDYEIKAVGGKNPPAGATASK